MTHRALWSGRFKEPLSSIALNFSSSIDLDKQLYQEDIAGSIAHVEMLAARKIISQSDMRRIRTALKQISKEIEAGKFHFEGHEDIHLAIETRLIQKVGSAVGGKLHTARSRNDQVALDERLFLRSAITENIRLLLNLQRVLLHKAEQYQEIIIPGYTHLQRAQPVLLSHHLLAYMGMFERDIERLRELMKRVNKSPLGAGAIAGTSFSIDRMMVSKKLQMNGIVENSIDAVSDRDYLLEYASIASILMVHLSRFAEEIILWSTKEFNFVHIDDAFTTGSSMMPQKKNPDMAELVRAKSGRVFGALMNLLTITKGLPLAYNRDLQEDKMPMFDLVNTTRQSTFVFTHILVHTHVHRRHLIEELRQDFTTATDMAEYLVKKGMPFRDAHNVTGKVVAFCLERKMFFGNLDLDTLKSFSGLFEADIFDYILPMASIEAKISAGSTSHDEVRRQIAHWKKVLKTIKV